LTSGANRIDFPNDGQFPEFHEAPREQNSQRQPIAPGVEGYLFNGRDGSQMAFWTCDQTATSAAHAHDYDESTASEFPCGPERNT
jgi:hypothetical protein